MEIIEIPRDADRFVLHFDTQRHEINAYALASSLVGLANAIKEANAIVNPGHSIEVVVERLEDGSFRAVIKTVLKSAKNIFSPQEIAKAIIYTAIATWVYEHTLGTNNQPVVIINDDSVEIKSGDKTIIVPRDAYEAKKAIERSERFGNSMAQVFSGALLDPNVSGLKITPTGSWPSLPSIPREQFVALIERGTIEEGESIIEDANLEISRAILARGRRRWEFYWRGVRISAPVLDESFYDKFFAHSITIAPGDVLKVALKIYRQPDPDSGITINTKYEIVQVYEHLPRQKQKPLDMSGGGGRGA
jgi:hypothetical protein